MLKWKEGRQGTGYSILQLWKSARFKRDCYIIRYLPGAYIPAHKDEAPTGFLHKRTNIVLSLKSVGGEFLIVDDLEGYKLNIKPRFSISWPLKIQIYSFYPSELTHEVTAITAGSRWVLSFGKLERRKE